MLGKNGLSLSEASHVANFLKELVKEINIESSNFNIYTSKFVDNGVTYELDSNKPIENWDLLILQKAKLFTLSAYLKEAIKLKDNKAQSIQDEVLPKYLYKNDLIDTDIEKPSRPETSFDFYFSNVMSDEDRVKYLTAETQATHVGKFIHGFDKIRHDFDSFRPTVFIEVAKDKVITAQNTILYDKKDILDKFEKLTSIHRDNEKLVNYYKASHKAWVADVNMEYQNKFSEWSRAVANVERENSRIIEQHNAKFENDKIKRLEEVRALKIVIPTELQEILDLVKAKLA